MKTLLSTFLLLFAITSFGQVAMPFKEAKEKGIWPQIEKDYKSGVHPNSSNALFKTDEEVRQITKIYNDFLQTFSEFLILKKFRWSEETTCFNRIYVNTEDKVDYFLYDFRTPISPEQLAEFDNLLKLFISKYKYGIVVSQKFVLSSSVIYPKDDMK